MPQSVVLAHSLRMYPMLACLAIWVWYFTYRCLVLPVRMRHGIALAAVLLAVSYSHATGLLIFGYAGICGLWFIRQERVRRPLVVRWLKINIVCGLLALPVLANSLLRSSTYSIVPGISDVVGALADLTAGPAGSHFPLASILIAALPTVAILAAFYDRRLRPMIVGFILAPIGFEAVISHLLKSIWLYRTLSFMTAFLALAFANLLVAIGEALAKRSRPPPGRTVMTTLLSGSVAVLAAVSLLQYKAFPKPDNFKAAAAMITSRLLPGDIVYVPHRVEFWGIAWYAIGPDWGSPLAVQGNGPLDCDDRWCAILERIGPLWRKRLHLEPVTRVVNHNGVRYFIGLAVPAEVLSAPRVWLVTPESPDRRGRLVRVWGQIAERWTGGSGLVVRLITPNPPSVSR